MNERTMLNVAREELARILALPLTEEQLDRLDRTSFEISRRMTSAAGKATVSGPSLGRVKLSSKIFCDPRNAENVEQELRNTIRHELAHVAAPAGEGHGPVWKRLAILMGDTGERCHEMAVTRKNRWDWQLTCSCCGDEIGVLKNRNTVARYLNRRTTRCCHAKVGYRKV